MNQKIKDSFSTRYGYKNVEAAEITIREDAPQEFRDFLVQLLYELDFTPTRLRKIFCRVLRKAPDNNNWSDFPNIDEEVRLLIEECKWFKVYDIIERILEAEYGFDKVKFASELNDFFIENGYGWKIEKHEYEEESCWNRKKIDKYLIEMRGTESFEFIIKSTRDKLAELQHVTASNEIHEALKDLSRRPSPDTTGAIQHSMASLECIAREITGDTNATLGKIIDKNRELIRPPLDEVAKKAWGFACEHGRHIREGREPSFQDAELIVGICASIGNYLLSLNKGSNYITKQEEFPF